MEQFVITPLKTFERLAKFDPRQNDISNLLESDGKLSKSQEIKTKDPQLQQFASNIQRSSVELHRQRVFPQDKINQVNEPIGNDPLPVLSKKESEGEKKEEQNKKKDKDGDNANALDGENNKRHANEESGDETDPPMDESNAEEALVHPRREYILKQLKKAKDFTINTDNSIMYKKVRHPMANIDKIADYLLRSRSSPRMRAPVGTDTVMQALLSVSDTKINKISLREDIRSKLELYKKRKVTSRIPVSKIAKKGGKNRIGYLLQITRLPFKK